jgi:hypothetical protein
MKRYSVRFNDVLVPSPMTFWVHKPVDTPLWYQAMVFDPSLPSVVPGKGFPYVYVEFDDFVFGFASLAELDTCIAVLSQKNLPATDSETHARGTGPGAHWLNKLPGRVKSWRYRSRLVRYLHDVRRVL